MRFVRIIPRMTQKNLWFLNPIPLNILRLRAKTIPQMKVKQQGLPNWHPLEENRVNIQTWFIFKDLNDDLSPKFIILYNGLRVIFLLLQCIMFHPSCLIIVLSVLYHQNQTLKPNQRHETRNAPDMVSDTDTPSTNNKQQTIWHDQRPIKSPL